MKTRIPTLFVLSITLALAAWSSSTALAQGSAFTYQGRLNSGGNPASGTFDIQFTLYLTNVTGFPFAGPVTNTSVAVTNGLFTTLIDFGGGVFNGSNRWLDIAVRTNGTTAFTELSPRQFLSPVPTAIYAETVGASGITGTIPAASLGGTYTNSLNFDNGANVFDGTFVGSFYGGTFMGGNFTGNFFGNGGGLYNLNSSALVGPVPASVLGNAWLTAGNAGTTPGVNFVGTTDNQPLELRANGQRILRLVPDTTTNNSPNIIGGSPVNFVAPGVVGATINGGGGTIVYNSQPATNIILGDFNTIGGGWGNTTGSTNFNVVQATVAGGAVNTASGISSTVGGGADNVANNNDAVVAGGFQNRAAFRSNVAGGELNTSDGAYVGIGGGYGNNIQTNTTISAIAGGAYNSIQGTNYEGGAAIGGGVANVIQMSSFIDGYNIFGGGYPSSYSFIGGGYGNQIQTNSVYSVIGGGKFNIIQPGGGYAFIAGGLLNTIQPFSTYSSIGGGFQNVIFTNDSFSVIGGGWLNNIQGNSDQSVIAGGNANLIQFSARESFVGGGYANVIQTGSGLSFIGGGSGNVISNNADHATIAGGYNNSIQSVAWDASIAGGFQNAALPFAQFSSIGGGSSNQAGGAYSTVPGGLNNGALGNGSLAAGSYAQATNDGSFVLADYEATNFYSTASNQLSARFTGGIRFVTGGAGMTIDGQPVAAGSVNASTLGGLPPSSYAPASGSANYIQNQTSTLQPANFAISGNAQIAGLLRSGTESGTSQPPSPAGLVVRRINSTVTSSNSIIAAVHINSATNVITLVRDGSNGGMQIQYPANTGRLTITAMGMDSSGTSRNIVTNVISPVAAGTVQLYPDSLNVVHFECTFGDTYLSSGLTHVTLSRLNGDNYWSGELISTFNQ